MTAKPTRPDENLEIYRGPAQLDLRAIESELRSLWKQASSEHAGQGRPPVTRVGTLNLLALAPEGSLGESALGEMLEISAYHPGRIFLLETAPEPGTLSAEVSAHCQLRGGGGQVCSEVIRVLVGERQRAGLGAIVAPLLIPDLPVILWLPMSEHRFEVPQGLLGLADRVLVDSHRVAASADHVARLAEWDGRVHAGVCDLAWRRLERWRTLVAQLFQEECAAQKMADLREVEIEYLDASPGEPCGRIEAVYLAAWLASRLGYAPPAKPFDLASQEVVVAEREDGARLRARFRPRPRAGEVTGDLHAVRLATASGTQFEIERGAEYRMAVARMTCPDGRIVPSAVDLRSRPRTELLRDALDERAADRLFSQVLAWLLAALRAA